MIFHYSYISVKNKSNNRTQISATEYRRNKIKRLLKKKRHNSKTRQNRDNTHENDKKKKYLELEFIEMWNKCPLYKLPYSLLHCSL